MARAIKYLFTLVAFAWLGVPLNASFCPYHVGHFALAGANMEDLVNHPTDLQLLNIYMSSERYKEAYDTAISTDLTAAFVDRLPWFDFFQTVFQVYGEKFPDSKTDFVYNQYILHVLRNITYLSLRSREVDDCVQNLQRFDQQLKIAVSLSRHEEEWQAVLQEMKGQMFFLAGLVLLKRAETVFLLPTVQCAASAIAEKHVEYEERKGRPSLLPVCLSRPLCTHDQEEWWTAAYKFCTNSVKNHHTPIPKNRIFKESGDAEVPPRLVDNYLAEATVTLSVAAMKKDGQFEAALEGFESHRSVWAKFYSAQIYKTLAERESDSEDQADIDKRQALVFKARDYLFDVMDMLNGDKAHLSSDVRSYISMCSGAAIYQELNVLVSRELDDLETKIHDLELSNARGSTFHTPARSPPQLRHPSSTNGIGHSTPRYLWNSLSRTSNGLEDEEMIHLCVSRHFRCFIASMVIFGSAVLLMLWLPIRVIRMVFPGYLPYRVVVSSEVPVSELSLEVLLLQVVLPSLLEAGHTRAMLKNLVEGCSKAMAWLLDLRFYIIGDVPLDGEVFGNIVEIQVVLPESHNPPDARMNNIGQPAPPPMQEIGEGLGAAHQAMLQGGGPTGFQPYKRRSFFVARMAFSLLLLFVVIATCKGGDGSIFYTTNDHGQTIPVGKIDKRLREEFQQEFLGLMGLTKKPTLKPEDMEKAAVNFMKSVYEIVEGDVPRKHSSDDRTYITNNADAKALKLNISKIEGTDIVACTNTVRKVSPLQHERDIKFYFEVPLGEHTKWAELRLFKEVSPAYKTGTFSINLYVIRRGRDWEDILELESSLNVEWNTTEWLILDATNAASNWTSGSYVNMGLYLRVLDAHGKMHDPQDIGIVRREGPADKQSFLVVYIEMSRVPRSRARSLRYKRWAESVGKSYAGYSRSVFDCTTGGIYELLSWRLYYAAGQEYECQYPCSRAVNNAF